MTPTFDVNGEINTYWTEIELLTLFIQKAKELSQSVENQLYDALIVIISCHGVEDMTVFLFMTVAMKIIALMHKHEANSWQSE